MWNDDFSKEIFETLCPINEKCTNECYKAYYKDSPYFVKKMLIRPFETLETVRERIESTERISTHFAIHGVETVPALSHDGTFTHQISDELWVAYPWLDASPVHKITAELCYDVGSLLGMMHNIPSPFQYKNNVLEHHYPDFSWIKELRNTKDPQLIPFLSIIPFAKQYADWGYSCAQKVLNEDNNTLSHCDLHPGNLFRKGNSLLLIDWELSGSTNPHTELFDVALNFCGFCDSQTNLRYFENVVYGYYSMYDTTNDNHQNELSIGDLAVLMLEHLSRNMNSFLSSGSAREIIQAQRFLNRLTELRKYHHSFLSLLDRYSKKQKH